MSLRAAGIEAFGAGVAVLQPDKERHRRVPVWSARDRRRRLGLRWRAEACAADCALAGFVVKRLVEGHLLRWRRSAELAPGLQLVCHGVRDVRRRELLDGLPDRPWFGRFVERLPDGGGPLPNRDRGLRRGR